MSWLGEAEHAQLLAVLRPLLTELRALEERLEHGEVHHIVHSDFAQRCYSLALLLEGAADLTLNDLYSPAFGLCRVALEHYVVDRLILLGSKYVQVFSSVDDSTWTTWQAERDDGNLRWTNVTDWQRTKKGRVRVVREGPRSEGTEPYSISIYYFLQDQFIPHLPTPKQYEAYDDGLSDAETRREHAEQNKDFYDLYLRWASLKDSLLTNGLADQKEIDQLSAHYRFLSGFVHPLTNTLGPVYGRNSPQQRYDHYSSELALLYVIALAVRELRLFITMTDRAPAVQLRGKDEIARLCETSSIVAAHMWFPGDRPHSFDRFEEANTRAFRQYSDAIDKGSEVDRSTFMKPESLADDEVRYYLDPLKRLVALHSSPQEHTTGFSYVSPFPRGDSLMR